MTPSISSHLHTESCQPPRISFGRQALTPCCLPTHSGLVLTKSGGHVCWLRPWSTGSPHAYCSVSTPSRTALRTSMATGLRMPATSRKAAAARVLPVLTQTPEPTAGRMKHPGGWWLQSHDGKLGFSAGRKRLARRPGLLARLKRPVALLQLGGCIPSWKPSGRWSERTTSTH